MRSRALDFEAVRAIGKTLPDVEESTMYGAPALKVRGKLLTCPAIHRSAEPDSIVVPVAFDQRAELIAEQPDIYYVTDHYVNYPAVVVRLSRIHRDALRGLLVMAHQFVTSKNKKRRSSR